MKRRLALATVFVVALALVSFLPFYLEQTMTRVWFVDGRGEAIEWGSKCCSLRTVFSDYRYFRHHPRPELWIALNIALAFIYAAVLAFSLSRLLHRKPEAA